MLRKKVFGDGWMDLKRVSNSPVKLKPVAAQPMFRRNFPIVITIGLQVNRMIVVVLDLVVVPRTMHISEAMGYGMISLMVPVYLVMQLNMVDWRTAYLN